MRKFMLMGALVAVVVAALAIPAIAQPDEFFRGNQGDFEDRQEFIEDYFDELEDFYGDFYEARFENFEEEDYFGEDGFFAAQRPFEEQGFLFGDDFDDEYWGDDDQWDEGSYYGVGQSFEQEAESGDVNQSFNVSGGGDNSNQCVGIQGVANTGNAQNQVGVIQYGSAADDFSFEDSGASITVSPNSITSCDQRVNQSASAFGR